MKSRTKEIRNKRPLNLRLARIQLRSSAEVGPEGRFDDHRSRIPAPPAMKNKPIAHRIFAMRIPLTIVAVVPPPQLPGELKQLAGGLPTTMATRVPTKTKRNPMNRPQSAAIEYTAGERISGGAGGGQPGGGGTGVAEGAGPDG
jgi:hypothetical protein